MTTTPLAWRSFTANDGFTDGGQSVPQTVGLAVASRLQRKPVKRCSMRLT
jgi:hypothetical protein